MMRLSGTAPDASDAPNGATGSFFDLTPDRVLAAVEASGLRCTGLCWPLNSFENRVYEVELEDGARLVAKFYRPGRWSAEQIGEEHTLLRALAAAEVPVPPLRAFPDGSTLRSTGGISYALWERSGGRAPDELDEPLAERLGMLVARTHEVAAGLPLLHRPRLDAGRYVRRPLAWLARNRTLPETLAARYTAAAEAIAAAYDRLAAGFAVHAVHADLHLGNVLLRDGQLRLLDFDDMATGPPVQDVWLAVPGRDAHSLRLRDAFLDGYERFRAFDAGSLKLVEPLRGLRLVRYAGWLARRWQDPAFRAGWPHFGTEEYWRQETETLEEQVRAIAGEQPTGTDERASVGAVPPREELLSNRDYFFDWEEPRKPADE
jgi:Ser/Thr protein kinase RdoA (MazF antagonist)